MQAGTSTHIVKSRLYSVLCLFVCLGWSLGIHAQESASLSSSRSQNLQEKIIVGAAYGNSYVDRANYEYDHYKSAFVHYDLGLWGLKLKAGYSFLGQINHKSTENTYVEVTGKSVGLDLRLFQQRVNEKTRFVVDAGVDAVFYSTDSRFRGRALDTDRGRSTGYNLGAGIDAGPFLYGIRAQWLNDISGADYQISSIYVAVKIF